MSAQVAFAAILLLAAYIIYRRVKQLRFNILLGTDYSVGTPISYRIKNMFLVAFGQGKMFDKPLVGVMHFCIYIGFVLINIEILEIMLDGLLGTHRLFLPFLGDWYTFLIQFFETLALLVVVACVVFLFRRNVFKIARFQSAEMTRWPRLDANIILLVEIGLMFALFTMNATDQLLQERPDGGGHYPLTGNFWVSSLLMPLYDGLSTSALLLLERIAWWVHILGILAFAVYVTYSKHLHIALAFPNTYFASDKPKGKIENMEAVTREVNLMLGLNTEAAPIDGEVKRFGAKDVTDLTWKNLMDAYSCTECGRCTASCPANLTGKKLSPRKIMMDTRDRADALGELRIVGAKDLKIEGKTLLDNYITREEILACTTCNACVEACPVNINPLDIIIQLRRYTVMEESSAPAQWNAMFSNLENNMAPWKFSPSDRANWIEKVNTPNT
jgi:heterodisulfide reductase subunit C